MPDGTASTSWTIDLHYPEPENLEKFEGEAFRSIAKHILIYPYPIPFRCLYSKNIENLMMGGRDKLPLSNFNFAGMGPKMMAGIMKKQGVKNVDGMYQDAVALGANIFACEMAMNVMGVKKEELVDEAEIVGVAKFIADAEGGQVLFI